MIHLDAGRYALYVWPAYGLSAVVLVLITAESLAGARRWRRRALTPSGRAPSGPTAAASATTPVAPSAEVTEAAR
jgi:heme exporter protein D